jgi:hypothetical protein
MDIKSIEETGFIGTFGARTVDTNTPKFIYSSEDFNHYVVQPHEEGRIDLVMESIYGDNQYENLDVILYLNNIDNPLSILSGMNIFYPASTKIDDYRYEVSNDVMESNSGSTRVNKTSNSDPNRSYPPTVNPTPKPPVTVENGTIIIGGIS